VDYKVFDVSLLPQISRLLSSASDDKAAYVIALRDGKTEKDLLTCLNNRPSGGGFYFDTTRLPADTGTLLGTGNDCTRTLVGNILQFSKCNISCNKVGIPTHLVLGGIVPFVFKIGTDVSLLNKTSGVEVDLTGEGSVVTVSGFALQLTDIAQMNISQITVPAINVGSTGTNMYRALDDTKLQVVRQIGLKDFQLDFTLSFGTGNNNITSQGLFVATSEIGSNGQPSDGLTVEFNKYNNTPKTARLLVSRAQTNSNELFTTKDIVWTKVAVKRVNGVLKLYNDTTEVLLYAMDDTAFANPITYNLVFDLSRIMLSRFGQWRGDARGIFYNLGTLSITKL